MTWLVDTNVLLRFLDTTHPVFPIVDAAVVKLWTQGVELQTTTQNLVEFWNVLTRPTVNNGWGLSTQPAGRLLYQAEQVFPPLDDSLTVYRTWRRLVVKFNVQGVQVHDARIAASMLVHGISNILTFNTKDFARFAAENLSAVDPAGV